MEAITIIGQPLVAGEKPARCTECAQEAWYQYRIGPKTLSLCDVCNDALRDIIAQD